MPKLSFTLAFRAGSIEEVAARGHACGLAVLTYRASAARAQGAQAYVIPVFAKLRAAYITVRSRAICDVAGLLTAVFRTRSRWAEPAFGAHRALRRCKADSH